MLEWHRCLAAGGAPTYRRPPYPIVQQLGHIPDADLERVWTNLTKNMHVGMTYGQDGGSTGTS